MAQNTFVKVISTSTDQEICTLLGTWKLINLSM